MNDSNDAKLLSSVRNKIQDYMFKHEVTQGTFALQRSAGSEILKLGLGIFPDAVMRIHHATQPFTYAAIKKLINEDQLSLDTKVFELLEIEPLSGKKISQNFLEITVRNLLESTAGWRTDSYDTSESKLKELASSLNKSIDQLTPVDLIRDHLDSQLEFFPGMEVTTSKWHCLVLGRVIEKISGSSYEEYIRENITLPIGAVSIKLGRSAKHLQDDAEAEYLPNNILDPYTDAHLEVSDSNMGLISSAADLCRFMRYYWLSGDSKLPTATGKKRIAGGVDYGRSILFQDSNGAVFAILFNRWDMKNESEWDDMLQLVMFISDQISIS